MFFKAWLKPLKDEFPYWKVVQDKEYRSLYILFSLSQKFPEFFKPDSLKYDII